MNLKVSEETLLSLMNLSAITLFWFYLPQTYMFYRRKARQEINRNMREDNKKLDMKTRPANQPNFGDPSRWTK